MPGPDGPRGDDALVSLSDVVPIKGDKGVTGLPGRDGPKGNQGLRGEYP